MSSRESRDVVRGSAQKRSQSKERDPPSMSDRTHLRIVLLGKSMSENSRVGNFILGRAAFDSEAPPDVVERVGGRLKNRHVIIINSPQLLQTNISDHQITQTVRECVFLSDPGPHVIVLLLKHDQCSAEDQERVEKVLDSFSERVYQHTLVLTTQEPKETSDILQKIIQKCSDRHFSLQRSSSPDDLLQAFEDIVQMNDGRHLVCAQNEASQDFTMKQQATERSNEATKRKQTVVKSQKPEHTPVSGLSSRRIVLLGKSGVGKSAAGNTILGRKEFVSVMSTDSVTRECSEAHSTVSGRSVSVVDTPGFFNTEMKTEELLMEIARSVYLSSAGPHAFLIVFAVNMRFTDQERQIPQIIEMLFGEEMLKYSIILFTYGDQLKGNSIEVLIEQNSSLRHLVDLCGGRYQVFNRDENNRQQVNDLLQKIDTMIEQNGGGHYSNQMYEDAHRFRLEEEERRWREELERPKEEKVRPKEELERQREELERWTEELERQREELERWTEELERQREELERWTEEKVRPKEELERQKESQQCVCS